MMLWIVLAAITAVSLGMLLLLPLLRRAPHITAPRGAYDRAIYRDQLAELERDVARGVLSAEQAAALRIEIQRRVLATDFSPSQQNDESLTAPPACSPLAGEREQRGFLKNPLLFRGGYYQPCDVLITPPAKSLKGGFDSPFRGEELASLTASANNERWRCLTLAAAMALFALLLYVMLGNPQLPGLPYATRGARDPYFAASQQVEAFAATLKQHPDAQGFRHLGDGFTALRQFAAATDAYRQAVALGDDSAWSALGESIVMTHRGEVVAEARAAFMKALKHSPNDPRAQFYKGLAAAQGNRVKEALAIWRKLLNHSAADAPWVDMVREQIALYADPKRAAVMAAAPEQQNTMIRGMVAKLEAKLAANPEDVEGWEMLARSYSVLGDKEKSAAAAKKAAVLQKKE